MSNKNFSRRNFIVITGAVLSIRKFTIGLILLIISANVNAGSRNDGGIYFPANQLLPTFPPLASVIDDINEDYLTVPEAVAIAALQGYVNSVQPRIVLSKNNGFNDGANGIDPAYVARGSTVAGPLDPWLDALATREGFTRNRILPTEVYSRIATEYADYIKGFVLYDFVHPDYVSSLDNWKRGDAAEWDISGVAPGTYKAVMTYVVQSSANANVSWKIDIDGATAVTNTFTATVWNSAGTANWTDLEIGEITINSGATSISLTNFDWSGNQNFAFNFMRLRYLKLVPAGGATILLTSGTAALSNNDPAFPKRGFYKVEPTYNRMMTDYVNLASSIAYPLGYLPVSRDVMQRINKALIIAGKQPITQTVIITGNETSTQIDNIHNDLKTNNKVLDITGLTFATESYDGGNVSYAACLYLYENWWKFNSKRVLLNTLTDNAGRYRMSASSDIAAATGAARLGLDIDTHRQSTRPNVWNSRRLYEQFLYDMAVSRGTTNETASVMGWNISEPAFLQASTTYAVGVLPSQYFTSGTFFGGMKNDINMPTVPKRAIFDKQKVYIAIYMSDGDNLQFMQNQTGIIWMRDFEDIKNTKIPINWTIAPSFVDIAPGKLNWFYDNANVNNCFVAGPSGAQYLTPFSSAANSDVGVYLGANPNRTVNKGPNNGANNLHYAEYFTKINEEYMRRAGTRVATLWHNFPTEVRALIEQHSRYFYGVTLQRDAPTSSTVNDRLRFEHFGNLDYSDDRIVLKSRITSRINDRNSNEPLFIMAQVDTWNRRDPYNANNQSVSVRWLNAMAEELKAEHPNIDIEFVRADHWFSFYNEHNGIPFDLTVLATTVVSSNDAGNGIDKVINGSTSKNNIWESSNTAGAKIITLDFGRAHEISRYVIRKADETASISNYSIERSVNGISYFPVTVKKDCSIAGVLGVATDIDIDIEPVTARYIRLTINQPGIVKIANLEIYGKTDATFSNVTPVNKPNIGDRTNLIANIAEYGTGKFYPGLPNNRVFTFNGIALMDWKNGDFATWRINVIQEGEYKVYMRYSKEGAFDKNPLDIKIFVDNNLAIENGLYENEATNSWNNFAIKELGNIVLTNENLTLSMTNDGSVNRPNNGTYTGTYASRDMNYPSILYIALELVSTVIENPNPTSVESTSAAPARIYPNPNNGLFTLHFETPGQYVVTIADINGKLLFKQNFSNLINDIDVSNFPQGVYMVVIDDGSKQTSMKIVKN